MNRLEALFQDADSAAGYAADYLKRMSEVIETLDPETIGRIAALIESAETEDNTIFVLGNGGSGAVAGHWVNDLGPNTVVPDRRGYRVVSLTDNASSLTAVANDADFSRAFEIQLRAALRPGDVVIALSVSGNSPNVLKAVDYAQEAGARTIGCCGFDGGALKDKCEIVLRVPSTRDEYGPVEDAFSVVMHVVTSFITMERGRKLAH